MERKGKVWYMYLISFFSYRLRCYLACGCGLHMLPFAVAVGTRGFTRFACLAYEGMINLEGTLDA